VNVHKVREEKGVTQKESATLFGVDMNTVRRWEQDRTDLSVSSLMKITKVLEAPASVLLEEMPDEGNECGTEAMNDHGANEMIVFEWSDGAGGTMRMVLQPTPVSNRPRPYEIPMEVQPPREKAGRPFLRGEGMRRLRR